MSETDADLYEIARAVTAEIAMGVTTHHATQIVLKALMAERERCAKLVEDNQEYTQLKTSRRGLSERTEGNQVGLAYAAAIRAPSHQTTPPRNAS